ncbi:hypothetical protein OAC02_01240 [Candidatus Pelagibacter sp.]|nr:hypothetical protein [Candidatus Pelagibacter sp.]
MKIYLKNIKKVLKLKKNEHKYLSPFIHKLKKSYELLYCNRGNKAKFSGHINSASSTNLTNWIKKDKVYLTPNNKEKYQSFISPCIATIKGKKILFVEAQGYNYNSNIICFNFVNKKWVLFSNFKLESLKNNFQSPFFFKNKHKNLLFYTKNKKQIECIELNKDLKITKKNICFKSELSNEKFSIYSPCIIKTNDKLHMFYAAWTNKFKGNINYAYSLDGLHWVKKYKDIFEFKKNIQIISEPFAILKQKNITIFFEFKNLEGQWNISYRKISIDLLV